MHHSEPVALDGRRGVGGSVPHGHTGTPPAHALLLPRSHGIDTPSPAPPPSPPRLADTTRMLRTLFCAGLRPYLRSLQAWMQEGRLPPPSDGFCVVRGAAHPFGPEAGATLARGAIARHGSCVPAFLASAAGDVLRGGRARALVRMAPGGGVEEPHDGHGTGQHSRAPALHRTTTLDRVTAGSPAKQRLSTLGALGEAGGQAAKVTRRPSGAVVGWVGEQEPDGEGAHADTWHQAVRFGLEPGTGAAAGLMGGAGAAEGAKKLGLAARGEGAATPGVGRPGAEASDVAAPASAGPAPGAGPAARCRGSCSPSAGGALPGRGGMGMDATAAATSPPMCPVSPPTSPAASAPWLHRRRAARDCCRLVLEPSARAVPDLPPLPPLAPLLPEHEGVEWEGAAGLGRAGEPEDAGEDAEEDAGEDAGAIPALHGAAEAPRDLGAADVGARMAASAAASVVSLGVDRCEAGAPRIGPGSHGCSGTLGQAKHVPAPGSPTPRERQRHEFAVEEWASWFAALEQQLCDGARLAEEVGAAVAPEPAGAVVVAPGRARARARVPPKGAEAGTNTATTDPCVVEPSLPAHLQRTLLSRVAAEARETQEGEGCGPSDPVASVWVHL